jgi:hypothetical protein
MNKKGFLLGEETLKIVLSVIAIGFLVFFLVSLYYSYSSDKDLKLAESSLEYLIDEINLGREEVEIYNPKGWGIISFQSGSFPEECLSAGWESCICICNQPAGAVKTYITSCNGGGTCLENDFAIKGESILELPNVIEINSPLILTINHEGKEVNKK